MYTMCVRARTHKGARVTTFYIRFVSVELLRSPPGVAGVRARKDFFGGFYFCSFFFSLSLFLHSVHYPRGGLSSRVVRGVNESVLYTYTYTYIIYNDNMRLRCMIYYLLRNDSAAAVV